MKNEKDKQRKIESQQEYECKLKSMQELDFDIAMEVICERVKEYRKKKGWTWGQIGNLIGRERTHSCTVVSAKTDIRTTNLFKLCMAFDWDMNELFQEILERMKKAPPALKKEKKKKN